MMDNMRGNTRMAEIEGIYTEIGSVYSHDISQVRIEGKWIDVVHTEAQNKMKVTVKSLLLACILSLSLGAMAGKNKESDAFKQRVAKNKLESIEIRVLKTSEKLSKLASDWQKAVDKLKEQGVEVDYTFVEILK